MTTTFDETSNKLPLGYLSENRNKRKMTRPKRLLPSNEPIADDNGDEEEEIERMAGQESWPLEAEISDMSGETTSLTATEPLDLRSSTEVSDDVGLTQAESTVKDTVAQTTSEIEFQWSSVATETVFSCEDVVMEPAEFLCDTVSMESARSSEVVRKNYKHMTRQRRMEANARERSRVHTISAAFETLRRAVPSYAYNQRLSKLAILRIACSYIVALARLADLDYSRSQEGMDFAQCVDMCTRTIQAEGKAKRRN